MNNSDANNGRPNTPSTFDYPFAFLTPQESAPVPTATMQRALELIDHAGIADLLGAWEDAAGARPARGSVSPRQVLTAWLALALEGSALTVANASALLSERLTPKTHALLGLPDAFAALTRRQVAGRVQRATSTLLDAMDAFPLPTHQRRLTKLEWDGVTAQRAEDADELEEKRRRFVTFANSLLGAQFDTLPETVRTEPINLAIDSRFRSAHAAGIGRSRFAGLRPEQRVSAEPDAGFFARLRPDDSAPNWQYGWEDELVILTPGEGSRVPSIVVGFNPHRPGENPARFAGEALQHLARCGHTVGHVVADRAYTMARPEYLSGPLSTLGAKLVSDYPATRLGVQAASGDSILVEGIWYASSMPQALRDAVKNAYAATSVTVAERQAAKAHLADRIAARASYGLHPKEPSDVSVHEQAYPYRSPEWNRSHTAGRITLERYMSIHGEARTTTPGSGQLRGATGQAFLSLLGIVGTNARIIDAFLLHQPRVRKSRASDRFPLRCPAVTVPAKTPGCSHEERRAGVLRGTAE